MDRTFVEFKFDAAAAPDGAATMSFEGYGAVFGNVDSYGDVIEPGAFAQYLADAHAKTVPWPAMLSQHGGPFPTSGDMTPIGVWDNIYEDGKGLFVKGTLADTPRGREIHTLMSMKPRPAIDGLSIGYKTKQFIGRTRPEDPKRRLTEIHLLEISPVTFPANGAARLTAVKASEMTPRELERTLRDAGLTRSEANALMRGGAKALNLLRDAESEVVASGSTTASDLVAIIRANVATLKSPMKR